MPKELISLNQATEQLGIPLRTLRRWIASGALNPLEKRRIEGVCKPTAFFDPADIDRASKFTIRQVQTAGKRKPKDATAVTPVAGPVQQGRDKPTPVKTKPAPISETTATVTEAKTADLAKLEPDQLMGMLDRLRQAEKASGGYWSRCVRDNVANPKTWTVAELAILQRSWKEAADQVRRMEKELPRILYEKGRYVDAEHSGKIFTDAVAGMCAELDQVGLSVAPLCVDKSALAIRAAIDDGVRRARRQIEKFLRDAIAN